jgi:hypothetical protein
LSREREDARDAAEAAPLVAIAAAGGLTPLTLAGICRLAPLSHLATSAALRSRPSSSRSKENGPDTMTMVQNQF